MPTTHTLYAYHPHPLPTNYTLCLQPTPSAYHLHPLRIPPTPSTHTTTSYIFLWPSIHHSPPLYLSWQGVLCDSCPYSFMPTLCSADSYSHQLLKLIWSLTCKEVSYSISINSPQKNLKSAFFSILFVFHFCILGWKLIKKGVILRAVQYSPQ